MTRALFLVASNPFYSDYLDTYPERRVRLEDTELVCVQENPWEELRPGIDAAIRAITGLVDVRIAGHLGTCFGKTHEMGWQQNFSDLAQELMLAHADLAPLRVEVWGFGHDPGCRIWAVLRRIYDVLSDSASPDARLAFIQDLAAAFAPEAPPPPVSTLRHDLVGAFSLIMQQLQTARDNSSFFEKARQKFPARRAIADDVLTKLQSMADRVADADRRARAQSALQSTRAVVAAVPAISGTPADIQPFSSWMKQLETAVSKLTDDLFL
jgi:hypothetical protein